MYIKGFLAIALPFTIMIQAIIVTLLLVVPTIRSRMKAQ